MSIRKWSARRLATVLAIVAALVLLADAVYLALHWPDWTALAKGPVPTSALIADYKEERAADRSLPPLRWNPVSLSSLPPHVARAFIVAEDGSFYLHSGVDWGAVRDAARKNFERGEVARGGSTISQQTAKNLFLSPSRDPLRKWHELWLAWGMERNLNKKRILSLYVNIAELGPGIFGVEAAARHYFGVGAAALSVTQAAELAATLPSPLRDNPATRTKRFLERSERVLDWLSREGRVD